MIQLPNTLIAEQVVAKFVQIQVTALEGPGNFVTVLESWTFSNKSLVQGHDHPEASKFAYGYSLLLCLQ